MVDKEQRVQISKDKLIIREGLLLFLTFTYDPLQVKLIDIISDLVSGIWSLMAVTKGEIIVSRNYRMPIYRTFQYIEEYIVSNVPY